MSWSSAGETLIRPAGRRRKWLRGGAQHFLNHHQRLGLMSHTRRNSISTSRDSWSKTGLSETHCSSNGPVVSCVYVMSARLLRLHKKCVEDARRRLEEYQHALKLRHAIGSTSVPLALNPDALHASQLPPRPAPLTACRTPLGLIRAAPQKTSTSFLFLLPLWSWSSCAAGRRSLQTDRVQRPALVMFRHSAGF